MTEPTEDRVYAREPRRVGAALIIGVGSVGSYLAEELANLGFSYLSFIDSQVLEPENLIRHYLKDPDVGRPKAIALAERLRTAHGEEREYEGWHADFLALDESVQLSYIDRLTAYARHHDVPMMVVGCTDSEDCQQRINELCVVNRIPAVYPAIWVGETILDAEAGHVIRVILVKGSLATSAHRAGLTA